MEGNASVYQVNPVSRISGEGRAEFLRTWGPNFDRKRGGRGGKGGRARVEQVAIIFYCKKNKIKCYYIGIYGIFLEGRYSPLCEPPT